MTDHRHAADEEAARWDARLRGAGSTPLDQVAFSTWLARDPRHRMAHDSLQAALSMLRAHAKDIELSALREEASRAVHRIRRRRRWAVSAAAAVAAALLVQSALPREGARTQPPTVSSFSTAAGQKARVMLPDGSVVTLDGGTRVRTRVGVARREVALLSGRALFVVAKDAKRPFVVQAGARSITALGTIFDVSLASGELRVTLAEGAVSVRSAAARGAAAQTVLRPRQQLVERSDASRSELRTVDAEQAIGWTSGRIYFDDDTLAGAVEEMARSGAGNIVVDAEVAQLRVSGMFRSGNREGFLQAIELALPVSVRRDDLGRVRVGPRAGRTSD